MAIRLNGLASGMDTDAIIEKLMEAHSLKKNKIQKKITTTEWKQEKWKDLNSKIYSLYTKQLYKVRLQGNYSAKKASSSNTSKVEVTAGANAAEGTHKIKVVKLASAQFLTGSQLDNVTLQTKLTDLKSEDGTAGFDTSTKIKITYKNKDTYLEVNKNTTVGDFIDALKKAGLNANYDTAHKRIFISSKESGVENGFTIETYSDQVVAKNNINNFLSYNSLDSTTQKAVNEHLTNYLNATLTDGDRDKIKDALLDIKLKREIESYKSDKENIDKAKKEVGEKNQGESDEAYEARVQEMLDKMAKEACESNRDEWEEELKDYLGAYKNAGSSTRTKGLLSKLGLGDVTKEGNKITFSGDPKAFIAAEDAEIEYNGITLKGASNNFTVNGLTLNLKEVTGNETVSISVTNDVDTVYNMVKDFIKAYNEVLGEMNKAYYAASARGYDPLTDEQKENMSDEEIEKWENKIKDSLLRRDDILGGLISTFRSTMNGVVEVDEKRYTLSSFGITSKDYTEKGILYIEGDDELSTGTTTENKLKEALTNDPDTVMKVLTKISDNLYASIMNKMQRTSLSSSLTVYNDKELERTLKDYKDDLSKLEKKLSSIEEKYYKQFAAMESALAKMNSQSSYLSSLLGQG